MNQGTRSSLRLRPRDQQILNVLLTKVRAMDLRQIAEGWFAGETANARRRLKKLTSAGLIRRQIVPARTLPPIGAPLVKWTPDEPAPDFSKVSYALQSRWRRRAIRPTTVHLASDRAGRLLGGVGHDHLPYPLQATHDLGLAEVWLRLRDQEPNWAEAWRGEDLLAHTRRGEKLPDAFVVDESGEVVGVVEFGGAYDVNRVHQFHEDCVERDLPYQLW